jgi:hypothetical protein
MEIPLPVAATLRAEASACEAVRSSSSAGARKTLDRLGAELARGRHVARAGLPEPGQPDRHVDADDLRVGVPGEQRREPGVEVVGGEEAALEPDGHPAASCHVDAQHGARPHGATRP